VTNSKRVVVTGAAGFIGSHLVESLLADGYRVRGVDSLASFGGAERKKRNWRALSGHASFEPVICDLRDADLRPLVADVEIVFHLAALPGVRSSWGDAFREYSSSNIDATARLLEVCREHALTRFVYASSSSVYGDADRYPVSESDVTRPISPYGVSKLAGEHLVRLYGRELALPTVALRFFTVYGPRQRPDMAFHRFIASAFSGERCRIFGDGEQTRDFTYVADTVRACRRAATGGEPGAVYNVSGGSRVTVNEVLELVAEFTGRTGWWEHVGTEPGDPRHTGGDASLARTELGYQPEVSLTGGLQEQVEWMRRELQGASA
jgi:nucleoside-diphosphate-sugar epimerase